jgi:hypothetical protein
LKEFEAAHAMSPSARTLAQIALAEQALSRWVDAERHLQEALQSDGAWIRRNRPALEKTLQTIGSHIGEIDVRGPDGAEVFLDGQRVGVLPLPARVRRGEGEVEVEVRSPGLQMYAKRVVVRGGEPVVVTAEVRPVVVAADEPEAPAAIVAAPIQRSEVDDTTPWWRSRWVSGSLIAASVLSIAGGVVMIAVDGKGTCDPPPGKMCLERYATKGEGVAFVGLGAALGITGGILMYQSRQVSVAMGGTGIVLGGAF